jgi:hypothetical protein
MASPVPAADLAVAQRELMLRYGSDRNATLRTLYAWFNLTLLLSFAWPTLAVFFDAPVSSPENTPADWLIMRAAGPLIVFGVGLRIWLASGAPLYVASLARFRSLAMLGPLWTQLLAFLVILTLVLSAILFLSDPGSALKVLSLGLAEALALQFVVSGYVKTVLEVLEADPSRIFWICAALYGVMFGLRGGLAAAIQPDAEAAFVLGAGVASALGGVVLGALFVYLRDRTSSLYPGVVLTWLIIAIIPAVVG